MPCRLLPSRIDAALLDECQAVRDAVGESGLLAPAGAVRSVSSSSHHGVTRFQWMACSVNAVLHALFIFSMYPRSFPMVARQRGCMVRRARTGGREGGGPIV